MGLLRHAQCKVANACFVGVYLYQERLMRECYSAALIDEGGNLRHAHAHAHAHAQLARYLVVSDQCHDYAHQGAYVRYYQIH